MRDVSRVGSAVTQRRRSIPTALVPLVFCLLLVGIASCQGGQQAGAADQIAVIDTVLSELGGVPTAGLTRGQRWRMISSVGAGLPPAGYQAQQLPEPGSRGSILMQEYCQRCHGLPAPEMHAAEEWPILVRRMVLRSRTLGARMGGTFTREMMGEMLMAGMASADIPAAPEVDSLVAYLQRHSMPTADLSQIGSDADAQLFVATCSQCHEIPSPRAHNAAEWGVVVQRMQGNAALMDVPPFSEADAQSIVTWLQGQAGG